MTDIEKSQIFLPGKLELSLPGVSQSVKRGEKIAEEDRFCLVDL